MPETVKIREIPDVADLTWRDGFRRACEHPGFAPTPLQQAFMDVTAQCVARGLCSLDEIGQVAIQELGIAPEIARPSADVGDWVGSMVFNAKGAVEAKQRWMHQARCATQLRLQEGGEIGAILGGGGKHYTGAKVVCVDEGGTHFAIHAKRGGQVYLLNMSSLVLRDAIDGAHASGKRKTSFEQFVAQREQLPAVSVCADPREPFYKGSEARERGSEQARTFCAVERQWKDVALNFSCKGEVGSWESLYGFVAHANAQLAEAQGLLASDACFGGGPLSDHAKKRASVRQCDKRLGYFQAQLDAAYPDWETRLLQSDVGIDEDLADVPGGQDVVTPTPAVTELARKINWHIGEKVVQATIKRGTRAIEVGGRTQAWLDTQVAQVRAEWATAALNSRVLALSRAIHDRNPDVLVRAWAKDGHGVYGNEGSLSAFREVTGLNLLRLSCDARAQALYAWANWSPDQVAQHQQQLADERIQRMSDRRRADVLSARQAAIEQALKHTTRDAEREVPMKWVLDGLIARGFDEVQVQINRGVGSVFLINRELSQNVALPKGVAADYVRAALDIR
ncbi:MAG: hypothetical protein K2W33_10650, partial [Burkholderiales bacterium]|nr:hypothetical protein [Burkholderiales bacterium]